MAGIKLANAFGKVILTDVVVGWGMKFTSEAMLNIGMSPQLVFAIHIGTNLVVAKHNTSVKKSNDWKDIENTLGLKPDQVQDLMKYAGKNLDDFAKAVNNGELDSLLSVPEMPEISSKFNYKSKYDEIEFATQLKNQEKGLNGLTIAEFNENRNRFNKFGRSNEASKLQKEVREKFRQDKIDELFASGLSYDDAVNEADKWMKSKAVLHDPDQIAGVNSMNLTGLGDKNINSSIGAQWRYRIDDLEKQIMYFANTIPKSEWVNVKLNIKLTY